MQQQAQDNEVLTCCVELLGNTLKLAPRGFPLCQTTTSVIEGAPQEIHTYSNLVGHIWDLLPCSVQSPEQARMSFCLIVQGSTAGAMLRKGIIAGLGFAEPRILERHFLIGTLRGVGRRGVGDYTS